MDGIDDFWGLGIFIPVWLTVLACFYLGLLEWFAVVNPLGVTLLLLCRNVVGFDKEMENSG